MKTASIRKLPFLIALLLLGTGNLIFAQQKSENDSVSTSTADYRKNLFPRNAIKINPLSETWGSASLQYERALNRKMSLNTSASLLGFNHSSDIAQTQGFGVGGSADLRFYIPVEAYGQSLQGFYFGPTARVYQLYGEINPTDENLEEDTYRAGSYSLGAVMGHQFIICQAFAIDTWVGANVLTVIDERGNLPEDTRQTLPLGKEGFNLKYGLSIGYAF